MDVNINIPTDGEFQKMLIQAIAKEAAARIPVPEQPEPLLTRDGLAKAMGISPESAKQWEANPDYPWHRLGKSSRGYFYSEVHKWLITHPEKGLDMNAYRK